MLRQLLDEAELAVAGVVDDDVQAPEMVVGLLYRGEVGGAIGDVQCDRQNRVAELVDQIGQCRGVARGCGDFVAPIQGGDCPFPSEAT